MNSMTLIARPLSLISLIAVFMVAGNLVHAQEPAYRLISVNILSGPTGGESGNDLADPLIIESLPNGKAKWVSTPGGPGFDTGKGVAPDHNGGAYVVGEFEQTMRFRRTGETLVSGGSRDIYLARYDSKGRPF